MKETGSPELTRYQKERLAMFCEKNSQESKGGIVFVGDSITEFFPLKQCLGRDKVLINRGIAGIDTVWLTEHIKEQVLEIEPNQIIMMIGVNDIGRGYPIADIVERIVGIIYTIKQEFPFISIVLVSVLPVSEREQHKDKVKIRTNAQIKTLNQQLAVLAGVDFLNLYDLLLDEKGQLKADYTRDGLHLTMSGYQKLAQGLQRELH